MILYLDTSMIAAAVQLAHTRTPAPHPIIQVAEAVNEVFDRVDKEVDQEIACGTFTASKEIPTDVDIKNVLRNNRQWVSDTKARDPEFFDRLGAGQAPKYLWIGCSDSRVPANQLMGLNPGDVFVHRNVSIA